MALIEVNSYQLQRDVESLAQLFSEIPRGGKRRVMQAIGEWLIANQGVGLRYYPPYRYESRAKAYGFPPGGEWYSMKPVAGYFSERQFRYVMAKIRSGEITPGISQRTGRLSEGWKLVVENYDYNRMSLSNDVPYAHWVLSDEMQARQIANVGWWTESQMIAYNSDKILEVGLDELDRFLDEKFGAMIPGGSQGSL